MLRRAAAIGQPEAIAGLCRVTSMPMPGDAAYIENVALCHVAVAALPDSESQKRREAQADLDQGMGKIKANEEFNLDFPAAEARAKADIDEPWQTGARRASDEGTLAYFEDAEARKQAELLMQQFKAGSFSLDKLDLLRRAAEIGMPDAVGRSCFYDPAGPAMFMAESVAFCLAVQHRIPASEPRLQQWVQMNIDKSAAYVAGTSGMEVRIKLEAFRHELRLRWQVREQLAAERLASTARLQEKMRRDAQARLDAVDPNGGFATPDEALAAFTGAIAKQDGAALGKVLNPLAASKFLGVNSQDMLIANLLKCHYENTAAPYEPSQAQLSLGGWKDLAHRYADTMEQCEPDPQPRKSSLDLVQIKGRWYVAYSRFFPLKRLAAPSK